MNVNRNNSVFVINKYLSREIKFLILDVRDDMYFKSFEFFM